ncbi:hypothetical protein ACFPRL_17185 [Pseudoclavibacter helvolus]
MRSGLDICSPSMQEGSRRKGRRAAPTRLAGRDRQISREESKT